MRDIKFRAWHKDSKAMMSNVKPIYSINDAFKDSNLIYMQYTGLKDSHGSEIYEGDIVYLAGQGDELMEFPFMELYQAYAESDIGVIKGNIYENPELIGAIV